MKSLNLKKYFRVLINFLSPLKKFLKIDPDKNWMALIVLFVLINLLFMILSFGTFSSVNSDGFSIVRGISGSEWATLDREVLNETIGRFETKEENFEKLKDGRPSFVDPSI